jgi:hypothetical protein
MSHIHRSPNVWALGFATMCLAIWASALWWGFFWLCLLGASVWSGWSTAPVGHGGRRAAGRGTCLGAAVLVALVATNAATLLLFHTGFNLLVPLPALPRLLLVARLLAHGLLIATPVLAATAGGATAGFWLHRLADASGSSAAAGASSVQPFAPSAEATSRRPGGSRCGTCGQRAVLGEATCPACGAALQLGATRLPS